MAEIQVESLTRRFGTTTAVERVSFTVEKGEIVGFLGPNGAGKSTTMRILTGALGATEGRVLVGGVDVFERPTDAKRIIGYLPEVPPVYTDMTVRAYLRYAARLRRVPDPKGAAEQVMRRVGLEEVAHRLIGHLSKGFKQRVGIAQALVHQPKVLILDEPTSGLDPGQRREIRELIQDLSAGEVTVILSTHVLSEVEALCDRVIIINRGRIVAQDSIEVLARSGRTVVLEVESPDASLTARLSALDGVEGVEADGPRIRVRTARDLRAEIARAAVPAGLLELRAENALEDVFLQLTASEVA
ncbi:MAG: ABC transporter ATP-binding protein [Deltaproteobacteria bacterium]|nr:ABC transporter ATP-binding protein [Deltaproteobacteria bacterium]